MTLIECRFLPKAKNSVLFTEVKNNEKIKCNQKKKPAELLVRRKHILTLFHGAFSSIIWILLYIICCTFIENPPSKSRIATGFSKQGFQIIQVILVHDEIHKYRTFKRKFIHIQPRDHDEVLRI